MLRNIKKRINNRKGFTLIELIVVVAILGVLAAIAVPSYQGYQDSARLRTNEANAKTIENAVKVYYAVNSKYPTGAGDIDDVEYLGMTPPLPLVTTDPDSDFSASAGESFVLDENGKVIIGDKEDGTVLSEGAVAAE